jgi:hypothetical protein
VNGPIVRWTNWLRKNDYSHETQVREVIASLSETIGRVVQGLPPEIEPYADTLNGWADDLEPLLLEIVGLSERLNGPELIERLLAGPENVKLTGEQLAFLEAHLKKAVNFAVVQQERKSNRNQESATWNRRKKLKLIRDYNRELLKLGQPERATTESGGGAESPKKPAGKGKRPEAPDKETIRRFRIVRDKQTLSWRELESKHDCSERTVRRWADEIGYDLSKHVFSEPLSEIASALLATEEKKRKKSK